LHLLPTSLGGLRRGLCRGRGGVGRVLRLLALTRPALLLEHVLQWPGEVLDDRV
jgi:hypothetical protein